MAIRGTDTSRQNDAMTMDTATITNATITNATITTLTPTTIVGGTWSSAPRTLINPDVAAAGTTATDAAQLLEGFQVVTGANGTVGVKLPTPAVAGMVVRIKGTTAGVLKVWPGGPSSGAQINAVGADTAFSLASGAIPAEFIAKSATQWYSFPLVPS